ncbi:MAG TPA: lytic murein transglycosylase [Acidimicrobiales bacterium]|nr:lytic murein transglycosylase [Acidimicrobiales bacterium]
MARRRLLSAALAATLVAVGIVAPRAVAEEPLPPATPGPPPEADEPLAPPGVVLAPPGADEAGRQQALADVRATEVALKKAVAGERTARKRLPALQRRQGELFVKLVHLEELDREATANLLAARERVRQMAIAGYVIGGDVPPVDYLLRSKNPTEFVRRQSLVQTATEAKADAVDDYESAKKAASEQLLATVREADRVNAEARQVEAEVAVARERVESLFAELVHRKQLLDVISAAAPVGASDIPRLFLDAYRKAASALERKVPHCRVSWTALAAIGKVESNHGRYRGARLALNGDVYPRILGIPLDGTRGTRVIKDTDAGRLDNDTVYDRAVGPMQFIPSTWVRIAQDGNGDGVKDPNNAYDAALAAAAYLCRAVPSGGLDAEEPVRRAFFSYNRSNAYVDHVHSWMRSFDELAPSL